MPLDTRRLGLTRTSGTPAGTAGHRRFLRGVAVLATWASAFSPEWPPKRPADALRGLQVPLGTRTALIRAFWWPSGREKAGRRQRKELRAPSSSSRRMGWRRLARPKGSQLFNLPYSYKPFSRKFGPSPVPLEAMQDPGWGAQRHRQGRRCEASRRTQPKLRPHAFLRAIPPRRGGRPTPPPHRLAPVPLGTRRLAFSSQGAAGGNSLVAKNHPAPKNGLRPRAWAEISPWRPPLPHAAGRNTPLHATRLRLPLAATESLLSHPAPPNGLCPRALGNHSR